MKLATYSDRKKVIEIIAHTFSANPGVNWLLKKGGNHEKKIRRMASYAFMRSYLRNGAFLSENEKGVALCYKFNTRVFSLTGLFYELRFALTSINLARLPAVLKRESYRRKQRPGSGEYLYAWFLGVMPGGGNAVFEIRDEMFSLAREENLPIYLETAMDRVRMGYERYGFETYHYWEDREEDIKFWFMKWEPA
jgi:hypothetical protein